MTLGRGPALGRPGRDLGKGSGDGRAAWRDAGGGPGVSARCRSPRGSQPFLHPHASRGALYTRAVGHPAPGTHRSRRPSSLPLTVPKNRGEWDRWSHAKEAARGGPDAGQSRAGLLQPPRARPADGPDCTNRRRGQRRSCRVPARLGRAVRPRQPWSPRGAGDPRCPQSRGDTSWVNSSVQQQQQPSCWLGAVGCSSGREVRWDPKETPFPAGGKAQPDRAAGPQRTSSARPLQLQEMDALPLHPPVPGLPRVPEIPWSGLSHACPSLACPVPLAVALGA